MRGDLTQAKPGGFPAAQTDPVAKKFPVKPAHPERNCWGCDLYCPSDSMACGNGSDRTQHPIETWGEDWMEWSGTDAVEKPSGVTASVIPIVPVASKG